LLFEERRKSLSHGVPPVENVLVNQEKQITRDRCSSRVSRHNVLQRIDREKPARAISFSMHISLTRVKSCLTIALSSPQVFQGSRQRMVRLALVLHPGGKNTEDTKSQKIAYALAPRSFDAKDREQTKLGRSPGFWLQTHLFSPSHPQQDSGCASSRCEEKSCSPVTVARLRRIRTDFPILLGFSPSHLV